MSFIMILIIYELSGTLAILMFGNDAVFATILADGMTILMAGCYLYEKQPSKMRPKANLKALPIGQIIICFIVIYIAGQVLAAYMYAMVGDPFFDAYTAAASSGLTWMLIILDICAAPICEELIFRGILYKDFLRKHFSPLAAGIISSVIFGAMHGTIMHLWVVVPFALLICVVDEYSDSILPGIVVHMIFNLVGTLIPESMSFSITVLTVLILFILYACAIVYLLYQLQTIPEKKKDQAVSKK